MSQPNLAIFTGVTGILAMVIKQFQPRAIWQSEVSNVEFATINGLQLFKAQYAPVEILGFFKIQYINRDVVNTINFQCHCSKGNLASN
jgi:hypothetical protein